VRIVQRAFLNDRQGHPVWQRLDGRLLRH
jgi:hypothetical protein